MKKYHFELKRLTTIVIAFGIMTLNYQCQRPKTKDSNVYVPSENDDERQIIPGDISYHAGLGSTDFQWPEGKKMGLSLTFDDARLSQVDKGIPLMDRYGVKGTFYVSPGNMLERLDLWKNAVKNGHDIGNHSLEHPCSGNFKWSGKSALENYTLERMRLELDSASRLIRDNLGIDAVSFAYPCGSTFVGRGVTAKSYIPVVASLFETGRGWLDEGPNDPGFCDLSQLTGMELDGKSFKEVLPLIKSAGENGQWLVFAGHEMSDGGRQTTLLSTLDSICMYASDPENDIWIDNVHNIASYIKEQRGEKPFTRLPVYKNPLYTIDQRIDDLLPRMTLEEKIGQINMPITGPIAKLAGDKSAGMEKFIKGDLVKGMGPGGGFFGYAMGLNNEPLEMANMMNKWQDMAIKETRLGIPLLLIEEGTHGVIFPGATIYPEGPALGSTWNMELIKKVYSQAAHEARSVGTHVLNTIVIEPIRDPRLGRNEEAYTEDTYLSSCIASAIVKGAQGTDLTRRDKAVVSFCHYPGQSQPVSGMERGAMEISERTLREVFLPPWEAGIKEGGALSVMATYPSIDGMPAHGSEKIMTKILREELGFKGIVQCEGGGIGTLIYEKIVPGMKEAGIWSINAGVDVGIWFEEGFMNLLYESIREGLVSMEVLDRAVRRVLYVKYRLGLFENPYVDKGEAARVVHKEKHQQTALQAAREGIVLLKNKNDLLPLDKNIKSIAVIGPNADNGVNQLGDYTTGNIKQEIITVLKGIKSKVSPSATIKYVKGCEVIGEEINEIEVAKEAAKSSDIAIVVLGESSRRPGTVGEGYDVANLDLTGLQEDLLKAVYETGTPTIMVLINGRPLSVSWAAENIPAIVEAWSCGEQGGTAVADVLFGDFNPEGRLTVTFPRHSGQLPVYYNYMPSKDYWINHGWGAAYADMPATPLWEFGYGLSYTSFEYSNLEITPEKTGPAGEVYVSVDVKNTGKREGKEVVQLYINDVISSMSTPVRELKGFEKISLKPGEEKTVKFKLTPEQLSFLDRHLEPIVEPGIFEVMVGSSCEDIRLKGEFEVK
jgi:beta-glucosidase